MTSFTSPCVHVYESPVGALHLVSRQDSLIGIVYPPMWKAFAARMGAYETRTSDVIEKTKTQLTEYFAGRRISFDLPAQPTGTPFQRRVWDALAAIPFGETRTYGEQATRLESPKASRAVGRADGQNPISIVVPCHRVIGKSGKLTGYAGGLKAKEFLLAHERGAAQRR